MNSFLLRPGSKISLVSLSSCETISDAKIESSILSQNFDQCSSFVAFINDLKKNGEKKEKNKGNWGSLNYNNEKTLRTKRIGDINISEIIKNMQNETKWKKF